MTVIIEPLCNCDHLLEQVVDLLWSEFSDNYIACFGMSDKDDLLYSLRRIHLGVNKMPCLVARKGDELIGVCNMEMDDLGSPWNRLLHQYWPWLANVVVVKEHRGKGYATQLINAMLTTKLNVNKLYLWTNTPRLAEWYQSFGFRTVYTIDKFMNLYDQIMIMETDLHTHQAGLQV